MKYRIRLFLCLDELHDHDVNGNNMVEHQVTIGGDKSLEEYKKMMNELLDWSFSHRKLPDNSDVVVESVVEK